MPHYYCYIDEAGDEGFGKLRKLDERGGQSTWLILGSIIVDEENNRKIAGWRDAIRARFTDKRKPDLHWRNLNHAQKVVASQDMARLPLGAALAMSHKVTIPDSKFAFQFKKPQYLYNYLTRWLLERLISACKEHAGEPNPVLHLCFSRRGGTDYEVMKTYLRKLARGGDIVKSPRKVDWSVLDIEGIEVENHSKRAGLQLADLVTSAFGSALEPNRFGNYEPRYGELLSPRLVRLNGTPKNAGLTVVPGLHAARCDDEQLKFLQNCWKEKGGQVPGS